jgi:hypothetical protein
MLWHLRQPAALLKQGKARQQPAEAPNGCVNSLRLQSSRTHTWCLQAWLISAAS